MASRPFCCITSKVLASVIVLVCCVMGNAQMETSQENAELSNVFADENTVVAQAGQLKIKQSEINQIIAHHIARRIVPPIIQAFTEEQNITATDEEIDDYFTYMPLVAPPNIADHKIDPDQWREMQRKSASRMIVDWKTKKALYEKYGGSVIFQQMSPQDPVGAIGALLREKYEQGAFTITPPYRQLFWNIYEGNQGPWLIPEEKVDFSKPWWQRRKEDRQLPDGK